ncbi:MAG: Uma2 family endonuclease [Gemmatimonadetes bacterium]|nr:Uma2 family endonuclease [Gemmatimonadota bacterium]
MTAYRPTRADALLTAEEFQRLPDDPQGGRMELVRGRVVREPPPKPVHGGLDASFAARLYQFVKQRRLGVVFTNVGFILGVDPDTVRGPDLSFVSKERIPPGGYTSGEYWRMAPDLAVEILSPSNTAAEIEEKVAEYLAAGGRLVWVVNPKRRTVRVYGSGGAVRTLTVGDVLEGEDVLPGFRLSVAKLFEALTLPR